MKRIEAEQRGCAALAVEHITNDLVMQHWKRFAALGDISLLESEGLMFDAVSAIMLFGILRSCKRKSKDFKAIMRDARDMERLAIQAEKKLVN